MTEESTETRETTDIGEKLTYQSPYFEVMSLAVITLAGTGTGGDVSGKFGDAFENGGSRGEGDYDDDPLDDPWSSRGGGG